MSSQQVAIVTGAADGIGKAIALRLASDGYNVVVADLPRQRALMNAVVELVEQTTERKAIAYEVDVTQEDQVKDLVQTTVAKLGGLDVMVANAGIASLTPLVDSKFIFVQAQRNGDNENLLAPLAEWQKTLDVNATGAFLCYREAAKSMIERGVKGRIVGASSVAGKRGEPLAGAYSASKFALRGLTQVAASEWAQYGIRVNNYAPGPIETPMLQREEKRVEEALGMNPSQFREKVSSRYVPISKPNIFSLSSGVYE
ncbi:hypothetical protein CVT26_009917 [Gymnopilus dilepis]|uniref:Uncharacterized protein n=1 Tax=Gymnopilus dilepis TaxID=231916 RepID=A0A409WTM7_9AGAR|nr:hypothetical protein CVT26_009917 [Gymnopilus dilepis]